MTYYDLYTSNLSSYQSILQPELHIHSSVYVQLK